MLQELFGAFVFRIGKKLFRRFVFQNLPFIHENNAVGHFARKAHFMRNTHHGHAAFRQVLHHFQHLADHFRVERGSRFVKQHHARFHRQPARNRHALLLTAGKLAGESIFFMRQTHTFQQLHRLFLSLFAALFFHLHRRQDDVFQYGQMRIQIEALKHKTHFLTHLVQIRLRIGNIDTVHPNLAALNAFKLVDGTDERRFAAARRSANHHHFTLLHFQIDAVDDVQVFEMFMYIFEFNHVVSKYFQTTLRTR